MDYEGNIMKSLKEKHLEAIETKDFWTKKVPSLIQKTKLDKSGACWQIDEVEKYATNQALELDKLTTDQKNSMPFFGLSVGMKDLFCIEGITTSAGSRMLETFKAPYSSKVWETLSQKGVLLGAKLSMDEFAMGSYSNTSYLGRTSIPGFPEHTAGGSSGGSGAALMADLVDFTTGSDTGGSVRLPASFCSLYGYKPTYGAFSRYGMIAYASSLDQAGLLTHSIEDLQYLLESGISEKDAKDMTCVSLFETTGVNKKEVKIGYFPEFLNNDAIDEATRVAYKSLIESLKQTATLIPVSIDYMANAAQVYYILATSEASSNLARYQGVYTGNKLVDEKFEGTYWEQCAQYRSKYFGKEVQKRIMIGSYILSAENYGVMYEKSINIRKALKQSILSNLEQVDMMVLPTSPVTSPKWDDIDKMTSAQIYMSDYMTVPFSLAGVPVVSVPYSKNSLGLGIGFQFVGAPFKDAQLMADIKKVLKG